MTRKPPLWLVVMVTLSGTLSLITTLRAKRAPVLLKLSV